MSQCGEGVEDMSTNINPIICGNVPIYQFNGIVGMRKQFAEKIFNQIALVDFNKLKIESSEYRCGGNTMTIDRDNGDRYVITVNVLRKHIL